MEALQCTALLLFRKFGVGGAMLVVWGTFRWAVGAFFAAILGPLNPRCGSRRLGIVDDTARREDIQRLVILHFNIWDLGLRTTRSQDG